MFKQKINHVFIAQPFMSPDFRLLNRCSSNSLGWETMFDMLDKLKSKIILMKLLLFLPY